MFGWLRKGPLLGTELTQWQFSCFGWLLRHTGGVDALAQLPLIQPTPRFFPDRGLRDHAMAQAISPAYAATPA